MKAFAIIFHTVHLLATIALAAVVWLLGGVALIQQEQLAIQGKINHVFYEAIFGPAPTAECPNEPSFDLTPLHEQGIVPTSPKVEPPQNLDKYTMKPRSRDYSKRKRTKGCEVTFASVRDEPTAAEVRNRADERAAEEKRRGQQAVAVVFALIAGSAVYILFFWDDPATRDYDTEE